MATELFRLRQGTDARILAQRLDTHRHCTKMGRLASTALLGLACVSLLASAQALYDSSSPVLSLTSSTFKQKLQEHGLALVEFYAPWCGHCKNLKPEYEKVAKALKGAVTVAAVDTQENQDLGRDYKIEGIPAIKFMYMDGSKIKTVEYKGQRTAKDIANFALEKVKSLAMKRLGEKASPPPPSGGGGGSGSGSDSFYTGTNVVVLGDDNFSDQVLDSKDLWLVEFYAPWCGHCKNLKPAWIEAATELKGKVSIGAVDCTQHQATCQQYGVQGYPTIKYFGKSKSSPTDYDGARESSSIVQWAAAKWSKYAPPPEVRELTDPTVWETECAGDEEGKGAKQLCFLAFLPDILDSKAKGRNGYVSTLKKLAEKYKDRPYSWLWAEAGAQPHLEAAVGVGGFGYPAFVALKPVDRKFSIAREAFEVQHMSDFVDGLKHGRATVETMKGEAAPTIKTITPWDGKDKVVQLEDEFSLDDLNEL